MTDAELTAKKPAFNETRVRELFELARPDIQIRLAAPPTSRQDERDGGFSQHCGAWVPNRRS